MSGSSPWLVPPALAVWGFAAGQPLVGGALALLWAALLSARPQLPLSDRDILRMVDLSTLGLVALAAGFLTFQGVRAGMLGFAGWLPALLLPLALLPQLGPNPIRLRHVAYRYRRSTLPQAESPLDVPQHYVALSLLSAATVGQPSPVLSGALALLVALWLFAARPAPRRTGAKAFATAALLAGGLGWWLSAGLEQAQGVVEEWALEWLAGSATDPYRSRTSIGELGRLKLSERILWRLDPVGGAAPPQLLRDGVYGHFDGQSWLARRDGFKPTAGAPAGSPPALRLRGETVDGRAMLPLAPDLLPLAPGEGGVLERNGYGVVRLSEAPGLITLSVARAARDPLPPDAGDLALPAGYETLVGRIPELAGAAVRGEAERAAALGQWFADRFSYTLDLGDAASGGRDLDRFLFTDRAGHCEYFATATVLLARGLGLPARYVTGYSVQEYSALERSFLVRHSDAHAWAELFVDGRWVEVDNTPGSWRAEEAARAPFWRPAADLLAYGLRLFGEWRAGPAGGARGLVPFAVSAAVAALAWLAGRRLVPLWRARMRRDTRAQTAAPADAERLALQGIEAEFAALGLARPAAEPPRRWLLRIAEEGRSVLTAERLEAARAVVERLYRSRYGA